MTELEEKYFRIITGAVLFLAFATYPYWKKPWTDYAGNHTLAWFGLWVGSLSFLKVYLDPPENLATDPYLYLGMMFLLIGVVMLRRNYMK